VLACPNHTLALVDGTAIVAQPEACDYTGACELACPTDAIDRLFEIVFSDDSRDPLAMPIE
jgi:NAD-dependent dihydropyrimidine dehydrogenase PreA subunit